MLGLCERVYMRLVRVALLSIVCLFVAVPARGAYCEVGYYCTVDKGRSERESIFGALLFGAAVYGVYKVIKWLWTPCDAQLIQQAQTMIRGTCEWYSPLFNLMEQLSPGTLVCNEEFLYELACAKVSQAYIDDYLCELKRTLEKVGSLYEEVTKRVVRTPNTSQLTRLYQCEEQLSVLYDKLKDLYNLLNKHRAYITLFECESDLWQRYAQEIALCAALPNTDSAFRHEIKQRIYALYDQKAYPLKQYADTLRADLSRLESAQDKALARLYAGRVNEASKLYKQLKRVYDVVIASRAYQDEKRMCQEERFEKQALELRKREVCALEAQADAMRTKNTRGLIKDIRKAFTK